WPELPTDAGVQNTATHLIVRWSTPLTTGDLNVRGYAPPVGPILSGARWPDVLVTKARSLDGVSLELTLYGMQPSSPTRLEFGHLRPGSSYRLAGCDRPELLTADAGGVASVDV